MKTKVKINLLEGSIKTKMLKLAIPSLGGIFAIWLSKRSLINEY